MSYVTRKDVLSWGRVVRNPQKVAAPRSTDDLPGLIANRAGNSVLPVGLRRSYGDSALNSDGCIIEMAGLDRLMAFDPHKGTVLAEGGMSLDALLQYIVPLGFFVPVTPGTRFVTLGGAAANDVHGKNHHCTGTFGRHVLRMGLLRSDGSQLEIGPRKKKQLFAATIGGLGLTGIITWLEIGLLRISSSELDAEIIPYETMSEFWQLAEESNDSHEHTVAWMDCTATGRHFGRGVFSRGNWSENGALQPHSSRQRLGVPFEAPTGLLNRITVSLFNRFYFHAHKFRAGPRRQHYGSFFYPLDGIHNWNRLYGRKGFWQYQCVVPPETMQDAIPALLGEIAKSGQGSFLGVLKTFGDVASPGLLSFPKKGATLALDFPNRGERTLKLFSRLDTIVSEANGRLYAAKDGRIPAKLWREGYPEIEKFQRHVDPAFSSDFWRRVQP